MDNLMRAIITNREEEKEIFCECGNEITEEEKERNFGCCKECI